MWDFLFDNQLMVLGSRTGDFLKIIQVRDGKTIAQLNDSGTGSLVVSSSGQHIIAVCTDGYLRTWDTSTFKMQSELKLKEDSAVFGLATSADGTILATASTDQLIRTYSLPDLKQTATYRGHSSEAWQVSFHPKENILVSAAKESAIRFWDMNSRRASPDKVNAFEDVVLESYLAGRQRLGSAAQDGQTHFWSIKGQTPILDFTLPVSSSQYMQMCFSEDGLVAAIRRKSKVDFIECQSGTILKSVSLGERGCDTLSFSPDQQWLAGRRYQEEGSHPWVLIHVDTAKETATFSCPKNYAAGYKNAFSPDSRYFAYAADDFTFRIWDLKEQREVHKLEGHTWNPYSCNFSHDGSLLVTSCWDGEARIWDVETGQLHVPPLRGHVRGVNRTEFTPDDRTLLTSGDDGTTRLWNVATGQEMVRIPDKSAAMFEDDGNTLVLRCCSNRGGATCIPLPTLAEIDRLESLKNPSHSK
jgi:WD40 repeat protein